MKASGISTARHVQALSAAARVINRDGVARDCPKFSLRLTGSVSEFLAVQHFVLTVAENQLGKLNRRSVNLPAVPPARDVDQSVRLRYRTLATRDGVQCPQIRRGVLVT